MLPVLQLKPNSVKLQCASKVTVRWPKKSKSKCGASQNLGFAISVCLMYCIFRSFQMHWIPCTSKLCKSCTCVCVSSITVFWDVTPCSLVKTVATFRASCCFIRKSAKFYITVSFWKDRQLTVITHTEMWEILLWSFLHLLVGPGGNASDILAMPVSIFFFVCLLARIRLCRHSTSRWVITVSFPLDLLARQRLRKAPKWINK